MIFLKDNISSTVPIPFYHRMNVTAITTTIKLKVLVMYSKKQKINWCYLQNIECALVPVLTDCDSSIMLVLLAQQKEPHS